MKIVFMGTPDFARESLERIYNAGHDIQLVITAQDKPKGRGMKLCPSPVKEFALEKNLKLSQPIKIKESLEEITEIKPDVIVVVAYGKIIPNSIIEIPKYGTVNVHGSLLPKYRGAAPIQWAVINGEKTTGITTMFINEKMDEGDMLLKKEVEIGEDETLGEVWQKLSTVGAELLQETLEQIEAGTIKRIPQTGDATYAPMLDKEIARINWNEMNAIGIKNLIRGLNPIMGAYAFLNEENNEKVKFWKATVIDNEEFKKSIDFVKGNEKNSDELKDRTEIKNDVELNSVVDVKNNVNIDDIEPGSILCADIKNGLCIKTIDAVIKILEIQMPNNRKMTTEDFLRGNSSKLIVGSKFK